LGKGSTFRVSLPLPAVHLEKNPADERRHPHAPPTADPLPPLPRLDGTSVLVVDDDADSRELLALTLRKAGANVRTADSGAAALEAADESAFDVLVSDVGMPAMDGLEMVSRLRQGQGRNHGIPAVALTAFAATEDRKRALLAGFDTFLSKPVDLGEVVAVIARMARHKQQA
jgi:CheY-like chemotaxis protein